MIFFHWVMKDFRGKRNKEKKKENKERKKERKTSKMHIVNLTRLSF